MLLKYYSTASDEEVYDKLATDVLLAKKMSDKLGKDFLAYSNYLSATFLDKEEATKISKKLLSDVTDLYSCIETIVETTSYLSGEQKTDGVVSDLAPPAGGSNPELLMGQLDQIQNVKAQLQETLEKLKQDEKKDLDTDK
jgi:phosphomevalonate kinase|tara:strand:+ start:229 stop:648 length:420 start_codon:yes stop_codon:yes gene_type:complete